MIQPYFCRNRFKMMKLSINIVFLLILPGGLWAQTRDLRFSHLSTAEGLSRSHVTCISQDEQGFMWIGTSNGLNRYDGYEFTVYTYHQSPGGPLFHQS